MSQGTACLIDTIHRMKNAFKSVKKKHKRKLLLNHSFQFTRIFWMDGWMDEMDDQYF